MSDRPKRRGPKKAPPETHFVPWHVTLPPDLSDRLLLLLEGDENKSELLTRLLESHPIVAMIRIERKHESPD